MAILNLRGKGKVYEISKLVQDGVISSGINCELVDSFKRVSGEHESNLLLFEKAYLRSSKKTSLTIMLTGCGDTVFVDAIGAGARHLLSASDECDDQQNIIQVVEEVLSPAGFS